MTELEIASRAAAGAMGLSPNTEWQKAQTVAEAVLVALAQHRISGQETPDMIALGNDVVTRNILTHGDDANTSPEIATIAARLMNHEDPDVRRVAASALVQR